MNASGPTLRMAADKRCTHGPRHIWRRAPERDLELGPAFRCNGCLMVRWAEQNEIRD